MPHKQALARFARWSRLYTATELAALLGVDRTYIAHLRAGRCRPSLEIAARIERASRGWQAGPIMAASWVPLEGRAAA